MSIRRKLAMFVMIATGFLVMMGGLLVVGGPLIVSSFRQSLDAMNSLDAVRELRSVVTRQRSSLNRYLLLDDQQELLSFREASREAKETMDSIKTKFGDRPPAWYPGLSLLVDETQAAADQVAEHYKIGHKAKAYEEAASTFEKLFLQVTMLEKQKSAEARSMFVGIQNLIQKAEAAVMISLILAFLIGLALFRSIYSSVMRPLGVLRRGADEFGRGHWDHRIDLAGANEFGALAESFNTMAENVKQLQLQAVHMDRMSAVGQLAGGVAHEINNPLTAVLGQAQILLARFPAEEPVHAQIQKIEQAALRCKKIVRGLLDFSRPSQTTFEEMDLNTVLHSTLDLCEADLKRARVLVEKKFSKTLPPIEGNPSELQQVFLNLFNNAMQAMPRGGTLSLDGRLHTEPLTFIDRRKGGNTRRVQGPWLEILVKDTGIGIAKEHLARVFEPFFTTKEIGKGTGLGLAVSMGIVQKHGGDLRVESPGLNRGATFIVVLPLKRAASGQGSLDRKTGMAA